jgi:hypothetical protein
MTSSYEKATSGVLRNAAALLDEMQLMGETQGECGCYCLLCCSCKVLYSYPVLSFSVRCQEGDQLRAVARVRGAAGLLAAAGEPRLLLPPGAQRAG